MADFETHDERRACVTAFNGDSRQISYETFRAGWLASRAWHRERNEREIEAAAARLLERREQRRPEPGAGATTVSYNSCCHCDGTGGAMKATP